MLGVYRVSTCEENGYLQDGELVGGKKDRDLITSFSLFFIFGAGLTPTLRLHYAEHTTRNQTSHIPREKERASERQKKKKETDTEDLGWQ